MTPAITDTISWWAPFEALEAGQEFTTRGRTVTEADVVSFAALTGDWHPQHCDAEWSAAGPFGERIAHGLLVVALRRVCDATFKRPVRFGDTLRVEGRIAELGAGSDDAGLVTFAWNVVNQDTRTVCRARVEVLWKRDSVAEPATERNGEFVPIPL